MVDRRPEELCPGGDRASVVAKKRGNARGVEGDIRARWAWVEPTVWTERMLATLETGIEGGKWFRLIDKVWSPKNLAGSLQKVVAKGGSAGIDKQSARAVYEHQEQTIRKLEQELRAGQYQPQAVKRVWIPKPGSQEKRPLGVPTVVSYCTSFNGL